MFHLFRSTCICPPAHHLTRDLKNGIEPEREQADEDDQRDLLDYRIRVFRAYGPDHSGHSNSVCHALGRRRKSASRRVGRNG